jgi:hypothetical protein
MVDFLPGEDLEGLGDQVVHGPGHRLLEPVLILLPQLLLRHVHRHLARAVVGLGRGAEWEGKGERKGGREGGRKG